ncbi:MAG: nitrilase-related carbon-nitrogen hydrolase, partial [Cytophagales bacterium]
IEFYHTTADFSYPYLVLGHSLAKMPIMVQWYSLTSALGGSFWVLVCNLGLLLLIEKKPSKTFATWLFLLLVLFPCFLSIGIYFEKKSRKPIKEISVLVLHPSIDVRKRERENEGGFAIATKFFSQYLDSVSRNVELHLWPENSIITGGNVLDMQNGDLQKIADSFGSRNFDLLTGSVLYEIVEDEKERKKRFLDTVQGAKNTVIYNSGVLLRKEGTIDFTTKQKLAPIEEYRFPNQPVLFWLSNHVNRLGGFNFSKHQDFARTLTLSNGMKVGNMICFESFFSGVLKRILVEKPDFFTVMLNEDWYRNEHGSEKTLLAMQSRAIESSKYFVRSSNGGYSGMVNHLGEVEELIKSKNPTVAKFVVKIF